MYDMLRPKRLTVTHWGFEADQYKFHHIKLVKGSALFVITSE